MVTLSGKVAAGATVALLMVGGFFIVTSVRDIQDGFPLEIIDVTETLDPDGCHWAVEVTMRNDSTEQVEVERIGTILNRRTRRESCRSAATCGRRDGHCNDLLECDYLVGLPVISQRCEPHQTNRAAQQ